MEHVDGVGEDNSFIRVEQTVEPRPASNNININTVTLKKTKIISEQAFQTRSYVLRIFLVAIFNLIANNNILTTDNNIWTCRIELLSAANNSRPTFKVVLLTSSPFSTPPESR